MTAHDVQAWFSQRPLVILAVAALAAVLAYAPSLHGPFLFDDLSEIVDNPAIRTLLPPWRPMFEGGDLPHRPIPYLSFAVNYQVGQLGSALFGTRPLVEMVMRRAPKPSPHGALRIRRAASSAS